MIADLAMKDQVLKYLFSCLLLLFSLRLLLLSEDLDYWVVLFNDTVNVFLEFSHLADHILDNLWREFFQNLILSPSHYKWLYPFLQAL